MTAAKGADRDGLSSRPPSPSRPLHSAAGGRILPVGSPRPSPGLRPICASRRKNVSFAETPPPSAEEPGTSVVPSEEGKAMKLDEFLTSRNIPFERLQHRPA